MWEQVNLVTTPSFSPTTVANIWRLSFVINFFLASDVSFHVTHQGLCFVKLPLMGHRTPWQTIADYLERLHNALDGQVLKRLTRRKPRLFDFFKPTTYGNNLQARHVMVRFSWMTSWKSRWSVTTNCPLICLWLLWWSLKRSSTGHFHLDTKHSLTLWISVLHRSCITIVDRWLHYKSKVTTWVLLPFANNMALCVLGRHLRTLSQWWARVPEHNSQVGA